MNQDMNVRLKSARMAAGYAKASQAVEKFKWNISTYRAHENGQNQYDAKTASIYAEAFRTSAAWLLTGEANASLNENNIKTQILTLSRISTFGTIFELRNGGFLAHRSH